MKLSNVIYKATKKHKIPADIYTAILMQESAYRLDAKNCMTGNILQNRTIIRKSRTVCSDFGIAQIHYKTVERYGFEVERLLSDLDYSVNAGAKVLSWFFRTYSEHEHDWWTRYNTGTAPKRKIKTASKKYYRLVSRYL